MLPSMLPKHVAFCFEKPCIKSVFLLLSRRWKKWRLTTTIAVLMRLVTIRLEPPKGFLKTKDRTQRRILAWRKSPGRFAYPFWFTGPPRKPTAAFPFLPILQQRTSRRDGAAPQNSFTRLTFAFYAPRNLGHFAYYPKQDRMRYAMASRPPDLGSSNPFCTLRTEQGGSPLLGTASRPVALS